MTDDPALDLDPGLERRWRTIREKLEAHAEGLLTQGVLVPKRTAPGRRVWTVRYVDRTGERPVHRVIYIGDDDRLVDLVRRQLAAYRVLGGLAEEVAGHARVAATASNAVRRLTSGRRCW